MGTTCMSELSRCSHIHKDNCENCTNEINSGKQALPADKKKTADLQKAALRANTGQTASVKSIKSNIAAHKAGGQESTQPEVKQSSIKKMKTPPSFSRIAEDPKSTNMRSSGKKPQKPETAQTKLEATTTSKKEQKPTEVTKIEIVPVAVAEESNLADKQNNENYPKAFEIKTKTQQTEERIIMFSDTKQDIEELEAKGKEIAEHIQTAQHKQKQKEVIEVNWGSFIKLKKKNFATEYDVVMEIGKGGFGTVSKVRMKSNGLFRAMKSIKKSSLINEDEQKIFAEMAILKQMDHPNIIKLHEIYDWKNYYYLITQLCEGGELFQKLRELKFFSQKIAASLMKSILGPVVYMHKQGIVHRDLKPENLLYSDTSPDSTLKIIDFGTSKKMERGKKLTKQIGTAYYIAPEVLKRSYDQKCDVWSCGVILYILLCGYPPFRGSTEKEVLNSVKYGTLKFQNHSWKNVSPEAIDLIRKMLNRNPAERISALEAMSSAWMTSTHKEQPLGNATLENLKNFSFQNRLKAVVMTYIASQLYSHQDKQELLRAFQELDRDGDGVIEKTQLIQAFEHNYRDHRSIDVGSIIKLIDTNNSGKIDFTQFLVAASGEEKLLKTSRLDAAFAYFDIDKSGYISIEEIKVFLGDTNQSAESIRRIFQEVDQNSDGKISKQEFIQLLLKQSE